MNDLAICKRIAEIENVLVRDTGEDLEWIKCPKSAIEPKYDDYNPLTDDALCFQLMIKYNISLHKDNNGLFWTWGRAKRTNKNPNKAILLAIIEDHKES